MPVIYPGSFDPITTGHCDIIRRMSGIFGEVILVIANSSSKSVLFTPTERKSMAEEALRGVPGVRVALHDGLTVEFARKVGAKVMVRGVRSVTDFEYEQSLANMNKKLAPEIETLLVFADPQFQFVASNLLKEVAKHGGSVRGLVPPNVEIALQKHRS